MKFKSELAAICILITLLWAASAFMIWNAAKHNTYAALDAQAQDCNNLRRIVEKTHAFAMSQPNNVRIIFRNLGYNVTMSPVSVQEDTTKIPQNN